jgi:hypothetical protein
VEVDVALLRDVDRPEDLEAPWPEGA